MSRSSYVTEKRVASGFDSIQLRGSGRVSLRQTGTETVEVRAPRRCLSRIETRVEDGTLILGFKRGIFPVFSLSLHDRDDIEFSITADLIEGLAISGSGSVETDELDVGDLRIGVSGSGRVSSRAINAKDLRVSISGSGKVLSKRLHAEDIEIKSSGSGKVSLGDVSAKTLRSTISGAGSIQATGSVGDADVRISGSGSLSLEQLVTDRFKARISGRCKMRVHARESLESSISGSGSILYRGTPQVSVRTSGSGNIQRIDEA